MCGRLGGEEFLVVITHVEERKNVNIPIERIRKQFQEQRFTVAGRTSGVTASFGIAGFRGSKPSDLNALVAHADTALYAAKHKGCDRMEFAN